MYYIYPAVFRPKIDGGYTVNVPDVPGCVTFGKTTEEALRMVKDALAGCLCVLEDEDEAPSSPANPAQISITEGAFMALIEIDTVKYRAETDTRTVRRNVSLPAWLNTRAEKAQVNCSQLLQKALKKELQIQ